MYTKQIDEKGKNMRHKKTQSNPSLTIHNAMTKMKTRERGATELCAEHRCVPLGVSSNVREQQSSCPGSHLCKSFSNNSNKIKYKYSQQTLGFF